MKTTRVVRTLVGLPGTSGNTEAEEVHSRTAAIRALRSGIAATASGDAGALNVWIDDGGKYRCEFMQHRATVRADVHQFIAAVDAWLAEWLPRMFS